jgi:transposase InsO family protein
MPWKNESKIEQRYDLVRQLRTGTESISQLCRRFKISRPTAYKWAKRYRQNRLTGLQDRSRRPHRLEGRTGRVWLRRLRRLRLQHPTWGARKLSYLLRERFDRRGAPAPATISRWLKRWGLARGRRRLRRGPLLLKRPLRTARRCHDVWTVDFKGWYRTADGQRVEPLTVRDLHSRYGLAVALLPRQTVPETQAALRKIFRRYGLPRCIRCDNGSPFGGGGPTGLTRLSAWWIKLGIMVDFITPGCPYENGAHEQFHRVYKAEVAREPEAQRHRQQHRTDQWLRQYNELRPHEALGMRRPAELFRFNRRRLPERAKVWRYPVGWVRRWVRGNGEINWQGTRRFVGEAFIHDYVGLKRSRGKTWKVYFGPLLIGVLYPREQGGIRMAKYTHPSGPSVPARSARLHSRA